MTTPWQDRATIDRMLDDAKTWAVVGLADHPERTAYSIASLLQERGKRIVPIHPVFADQAVEIGAGGVWFQLGVIDAEAFERTTAAGVPMVMDTCPAIEWRRRGR
jgi:predicted CoA-binding protein